MAKCRHSDHGNDFWQNTLPHARTFPSGRRVSRNLSHASQAKSRSHRIRLCPGQGTGSTKILTDAGLPVAVDQAIARFVPVYEQNNIAFNPYELFDRDQNVSGRILLLPANFRYQRFFKNLSRGYTIYLSGWGMDGNARQRFGVDRVIPLSDHADYQQLWEVVEKVRPQVVYCTHGFPEFVADLRASGYQANVLSAATE